MTESNKFGIERLAGFLSPLDVSHKIRTGVAGMHVSLSLLFLRTCIPRDVCFLAHISLTHNVLQVVVKYVSLLILFPHLRCENLATTQLDSYWAMHDVIR